MNSSRLGALVRDLQRDVDRLVAEEKRLARDGRMAPSESAVPLRVHRRLRRVAIALGILVALPAAAAAAAAIGFHPFLRAQVETLASSAMKVPVVIDRARVNLAGGVHLHRLAVGNPQAFKEVRAFRADRVAAEVSPASAFGDTVAVHDLMIVHPQLTIEFGRDRINWSEIMDRLAAPAKQPVEEVKRKEKKFIIHRLRIVRPVVHLRSPKFARGGAAITLRDIELTEIGTAPGSAAPFSLVLATIFQALLTGTIDEWTDLPGDLGGSLERTTDRTSKAYGAKLRSRRE